MMMGPNPTPRSTIAPPSSTSPTIVGSKTMAAQNQDQQQTPPPPPTLGPLKCPRCDSSNTKFCYYNNYSLLQPRHFCKACKRYWTRGGTLRNVPVGGGCRKNKRINKKHQSARAETPSTSVVTKNPNPNNPLINLPTNNSSELNSLIYAPFSTASSYDDNNINGGLVIPSNQLSSRLIDLHQTSDNFLSNGCPSFKFGSQDVASFLQQDCMYANLGLKDVKVEGIESINAMGNNISNHVDLWQANYPFDQALNFVATDTSYMIWNPPIGGTYWPDAAANSSVTPLI